ncbi:unnamed protein product [Heligmosomoides polygyrus]|uniref:RanBD1 domain-containing protein n=1 Tax=Heligmosomoides polygyrus TaxID=6339 RepID=A0A3P7ZRX6_HELPZ|nr:unnamed protein product [Heligmosomoides polygyrus]
MEYHFFQTPKSDTAAQKPVLSFITSKPTTSPAVSEPPKPTSIFAGIKPTENVFSKSEFMWEMQVSGDAPDDDDHDHVEEFEPQVDFKPVCPLPELVKVVTGEEDEKVIFEERCKLYRYSDESKEWKERGTGVMKVLENASTKKCRIVMRREQVYKVCANHQLLPGMTVQPMSRQEKAMVWYCEDFSEEEGTHEKLSARFSSSEVANKFKEVFENAVKSAEKGERIYHDNAGVEKQLFSNNSLGPALGQDLDLFRWECPECYSRTDAEKCPCCGACKGGTKAPEPVARYVGSSIYLSMFRQCRGFSGSLSFASVAKASSGSIFDPVNIQKAKAEFDAQAKSKADSGDGEGEGGPDVHFAPVIPLPDLVDVVTGEEEEQVMFTARAKLFRFIKETKENKERGVGDLKILRNPKTNAYRVVMRREQVHKVCANFAILPTIELNEKKGMPNVYNWICRDYSESPDGIDEIFTAKFKSAEIAKEFHDKFKEAAAAHPVRVNRFR